MGKSIAEDFRQLGIYEVADLKRQDPEQLYEQLQQIQGRPIDRCMLYVLRCAVYFASQRRHDPEKLKWWNWQDKH